MLKKSYFVVIDPLHEKELIKLFDGDISLLPVIEGGFKHSEKILIKIKYEIWILSKNSIHGQSIIVSQR